MTPPSEAVERLTRLEAGEEYAAVYQMADAANIYRADLRAVLDVLGSEGLEAVEPLVRRLRMYCEEWAEDGYIKSGALHDIFTDKLPSLLAALSPVERWRGISSAPVNEVVQIWRPSQFRDDNVFVAEWEDGELWKVGDGKNWHPLRGRDPTHWRPLPEAPASGGTVDG